MAATPSGGPKQAISSSSPLTPACRPLLRVSFAQTISKNLNRLMKAIIAFLFISAAGVRADEAVHQVAVCDVLRDPVRWNGKLIEVTGPIMTVQDYWVMGLGCEGAVKVKGVTFPSGFVLQHPFNKRLYSHAVDFDWDRQSKDELDFLAKEAMRTKQRVFATVVGIFETRDPIDGLINTNAPFKYQGFGHEGGAAGQIIVKTVKKMRIEEKDSLTKK